MRGVETGPRRSTELVAAAIRESGARRREIRRLASRGVAQRRGERVDRGHRGVLHGGGEHQRLGLGEDGERRFRAGGSSVTETPLPVTSMPLRVTEMT